MKHLNMNWRHLAIRYMLMHAHTQKHELCVNLVCTYLICEHDTLEAGGGVYAYKLNGYTLTYL